MAVRNDLLGGSDWVDGNILWAADLNDTLNEGFGVDNVTIERTGGELQVIKGGVGLGFVLLGAPCGTDAAALLESIDHDWAGDYLIPFGNASRTSWNVALQAKAPVNMKVTEIGIDVTTNNLNSTGLVLDIVKNGTTEDSITIGGSTGAFTKTVNVTINKNDLFAIRARTVGSSAGAFRWRRLRVAGEYT